MAGDVALIRRVTGGRLAGVPFFPSTVWSNGLPGLLATDHVDLDRDPWRWAYPENPRTEQSRISRQRISQICGTLTPDAGTVLLHRAAGGRLDAAAQAARAASGTPPSGAADRRRHLF